MPRVINQPIAIQTVTRLSIALLVGASSVDETRENESSAVIAQNGGWGRKWEKDVVQFISRLCLPRAYWPPPLKKADRAADTMSWPLAPTAAAVVGALVHIEPDDA